MNNLHIFISFIVFLYNFVYGHFYSKFFGNFGGMYNPHFILVLMVINTNLIKCNQ